MSKRERKAFVEGIKITLEVMAVIISSIAFVLYAVWTY